MADGQHAHEVVSFEVAVQGHVTGFAARNDQLAHIALHDPADERMALQHGDRFEDAADGLAGKLRFAGHEKLEQALEISLRSPRKSYLRQRLSRGRCARFPESLASKYVRTSAKSYPRPVRAISRSAASASSMN